LTIANNPAGALAVQSHTPVVLAVGKDFRALLRADAVQRSISPHRTHCNHPARATVVTKYGVARTQVADTHPTLWRRNRRGDFKGFPVAGWTHHHEPADLSALNRFQVLGNQSMMGRDLIIRFDVAFEVNQVSSCQPSGQ
jgi:hypothetical protein